MRFAGAEAARLEAEERRLERGVLERLRRRRLAHPVLRPVGVQQVCLLAVGGELGGDLLQPLGVAPGPPEAAEAEGHQHADGNHARMARLLLVGRGVDKGAEAGVAGVVDKVDEVVGDGVQARRQALVLDGALELEARHGLLPDDGVAGLDVEVDQEEGRDGRQVGEGRGRELRQPDGEGRLPATGCGHGDCEIEGGLRSSVVSV